ncbi:cytochrome P450 [Mycobacterium vicinigordonae]|uniref:Cytochrome P450 n=1 Tax=Mycobacterium vicinigordonae TaxID=1719132 RepID=A0A7D6EBG7_9MYCO|nr:cytochrome P450 [Mycobacterium vicinigordonae]QLL09105.1 cytochrome P450 [Mycobacterium vicinigordonae]
MTSVNQTSANTSSIPHISWPELPFAEDRAVGWAALRDAGPVVYEDPWYYFTRREDVLEALRNPEVFSSKKAYDVLGSPLPLLPLSYDPPEHTRYRKILQPFFSPGTLSKILPSLQQQAIDIIKRACADDRCEVISELAMPYPSQVFLTMFGLPLADRDRLIAWKDAVIHLSEIPDMANADLTPALELFAYLTESIADHRANPRDDLLSSLLGGADPLDDNEALGLAFLFILAGLDTVTGALGMALLELARNREICTHLRTHPQDTRLFVEEMVRLEPPAPLVVRATTREVQVGGMTVPAGSLVKLCMGGINRDESDDTSANHIVMDGKVHKHWGFGGGPHRCLGSHLARMELTLIVNEWLARVPDFSVEPGFVPCINWPANTFGLARLPLLLHK